MPDIDPIHTVHSIWSAVLTLLGGIGTMFIKNLRDELKQKVDRTEVEQLRSDLSEWKSAQEEQHKENRERLDRILLSLRPNGR